MCGTAENSGAWNVSSDDCGFMSVRAYVSDVVMVCIYALYDGLGAASRYGDSESRYRSEYNGSGAGGGSSEVDVCCCSECYSAGADGTTVVATVGNVDADYWTVCYDVSVYGSSNISADCWDEVSWDMIVYDSANEPTIVVGTGSEV